MHKRAGEAGQGGRLTKRAELMLELVCDIKNNKRKDGAAGGRTASIPAPILKWLKQQCRVEEACLRSLTWAKVLLPPEERRGLWWQPRAGEALEGDLGAQLAASEGGRGVVEAAVRQLDEAEGGATTQELLALAAKMRMNTDTRRAVFCIVMGSDDYLDCAEKLLRLPLRGEQERELVRVTVACCLHERTFNPYYALVATRLASVSKSHKMTLQFCVWDQVKELERMEAPRVACLARLLGFLLARGALPLSAAKVADFSRLAGAREVGFWRLVLFNLLGDCKGTADVDQVFGRLVGHAQLNSLRSDLRVFVRTRLGPWLAEKHAKASIARSLWLAPEMCGDSCLPIPPAGGEGRQPVRVPQAIRGAGPGQGSGAGPLGTHEQAGPPGE